MTLKEIENEAGRRVNKYVSHYVRHSGNHPLWLSRRARQMFANYVTKLKQEYGVE